MEIKFLKELTYIHSCSSNPIHRSIEKGSEKEEKEGIKEISNK